MKNISFVFFGLLTTFAMLQNASAQVADWPQPRHDDHLTALQPTPGNMKSAPTLMAEIDLGRSAPAAQEIELAHGQRARIAIIAGELRCYDPAGKRLWSSHPQGINFTAIIDHGDFDGKGDTEIALQAGRPAAPYGAAVLVSAQDGRVLWRYDVEPMSYSWTLHVFNGADLPNGRKTKQIFVIMHGYPPDAKNGYCAMFAPGADRWQQKWRYDFSEYTCFPNVFEEDLSGGGHKELAIISHSRMWVLSEKDGALEQFLQWDVAPANHRSYGLNQFVDLNGDGKLDFLCLSAFAKHYEVLLNDNGKMREAWHFGWDQSVMTGTIAVTWPAVAYGDVDGDEKPEVVVSIFNADKDGGWSLRVHDAVSGSLKYHSPGFIAARLINVPGGFHGILADRSDDGSDATNDGSYSIHHVKGVALLKVVDGALKPVWEEKSGRAVREAEGPPRIQIGADFYALNISPQGAVTATPWTAPQPVAATVAPLPKDAPSGPMPEILVADMLGEGRNQLLLYREGKATIWKWSDGKLRPAGEYASSCLPVIADLDGDGKTEMVLAQVEAGQLPRFRAITPGLKDRVLWDVQLPATNRIGLPQPRIAYLRQGRFTGRQNADIYAWVGTPLVRSLLLRGDTGALVWEKGQIGEGERYWGPTANLTSVTDVNGDGKEDLIFTDPDEYCVASGSTGDFLVGPLSQPKLFNQPSQGLYTMPVVLGDGPTAKVCLVGGHYFRAVLSADGKPGWYALPVAGEARCANEAFLPVHNGQWLMGFGRQNGQFACLNVSDGSLRWNLEVGASCSAAAVCDIDGDGKQEFVFGTSLGVLYAVGDDEGKPRVVWKTKVGAGLGTPVLADINGDGKSDIVIPAEDGTVRVYGAGK